MMKLRTYLSSKILIFLVSASIYECSSGRNKKSGSASPINVKIKLLDDVSVTLSWSSTVKDIEKYDVVCKPIKTTGATKSTPVSGKSEFATKSMTVRRKSELATKSTNVSGKSEFATKSTTVIGKSEFELKGLARDAEYTVTVIGFKNEKQYKSSPLTFRTLSSSRPVNLKSIQTSNHSIKFSWKMPAGMENIEKYSISYRPANAGKGDEKVISNIKSTSVNITGLKLNTEYDVFVTAFKLKKKYMSSTRIRALEGAYPENIKILCLDLNTVKITWDVKSRNVKKYEVMIIPVDCPRVLTIYVTKRKVVRVPNFSIGVPYQLMITTSTSSKEYTSNPIIFCTVKPEIHYYKYIKQFDDLVVDQLTDIEIPNRPSSFDFIKNTNNMNETFSRVIHGKTIQLNIHVYRENPSIILGALQTFRHYRHDPRPLTNLPFKLDFINENGVDNGGIKKEWFSIVSKEAFNPNFGLFKYVDENSSTVEINPLSKQHQIEHFEFFGMLGMLTGLAIRNQCLLEVDFSIPFLKTILHRPISMNDVRLTDIELYRSLHWIENNDPTNQNWTFIAPESTDDNVIELMKNGANIPVDKKNKLKYIRLMINWRFIGRVKIQMAAFIEGFRTFLPLKYIDKFTENELREIISGSRNIDVDFWRQCTTYEDYESDSQQIQWFWKAVKSFDDEKRSRLLEFVTGSSRFSLQGLRPFKFVIEKLDYLSTLPRASTCLNTLFLPKYENYEDLVKNLTTITEYTSIFEFNK